MRKFINVVSHQGELMESTYPKRAKQLVKLSKAKWIDHETICLIKNEVECAALEYNSNGSKYVQDTDNEMESTIIKAKGAIPIFENRYTDEELYKMAKKKLQKRSALIVHSFAYIAVNIFLFFIAISNGEMWNFYVLGGWGIGLTCHAASYFFSVTPEDIQNEYLKQKNKYRY